jgi:hypothetical protein
MEPAENVALLALMYREKHSPWWEFTDDLSLLGKQVRDEPLPEIDEFILNHMDKVEELAEMVELAGLDPLRYEALLHAWPPGPNNDPPPEEGFDRTLFTPERWEEVEDAMWQIYASGITHRPSFVNAIFEEAYELALAQIGLPND